MHSFTSGVKGILSKESNFYLDLLFQVYKPLIQGGYLPWVILGYNVITGGDVTTELMGLASAHIYIVLKDILPTSHQYRFLETPKFL